MLLQMICGRYLSITYNGMWLLHINKHLQYKILYKIKQLSHINSKLEVQTFSKSQCSRLVRLDVVGNLCSNCKCWDGELIRQAM